MNKAVDGSDGPAGAPMAVDGSVGLADAHMIVDGSDGPADAPMAVDGSVSLADAPPPGEAAPDITEHNFEFYRVPGEGRTGSRYSLPEHDHPAPDLDIPSKLKTWRQVERWLKGRPSHDKKYKDSHVEKIRLGREAHSLAFDALRLSRPFVVIDSEGQDYEGDDIVQNGARYKDHGTYLWCATTSAKSGIPDFERQDPTERPHILRDANSCGTDKRKLDVKTILDWLLSLSSKYASVRINREDQSGAIFVMFGSGYDITQILANTTLRTAHNVVRRVDYDDDEEARNAPEFWGRYAFSYMKRKWFDVWELRDPSKPWKDVIDRNGYHVIDKNTGKPKQEMDAIRHIKIYETFGYFQKKFADIVDDMVKRKMATEYEQALIGRMKERRGKFAQETIDDIEEYCLTECRLLSKQMAELREMFFLLGFKPRGWHGPGAVASAVITQRKLARHFGKDIAAFDISEQQDWAHHAFVGGRIETLQQGYLKSDRLHVYDVSSCYPAATIALPSLASEYGAWKRLDAKDMAFSNLTELLARVEAASPVSMYKVRWKFPTMEKRLKIPARITDEREREYWERSRATFLPFYPLPYRTKSGAILFPSSGRSICARDDMIAAIKWMMRFTPAYPSKTMSGGSPVVFEIEGAWIWEASENTVYPFAFMGDMYNHRRAVKNEATRSGVYDPMEMVIKLVINSIYGKLAQFVGEKGKVPKTANPYYAAAIAASGRRRLCEAALVDPHAIIFLATDGIVSSRPLHDRPGGLDRVKTEGRDVISLGDWEYVQGDGGLFVGSGIYIYWKYKVDEYGEPERNTEGNIILKPVAKLRGANVKNYKLDADGSTRQDRYQWLVQKVVHLAGEHRSHG